MVPNVFVNIDVVRAIARRYKEGTREILSHDEGRLGIINKKILEDVFMLDERKSWPLNVDELSGKFKSHDRIYRSRVPAFRPTHLIRDEKALTLMDQPPYSIYLFVSYLNDTYFSLCQVLGLDAKLIIPNWMLVLCMDIQRGDHDRDFDCESLLSNKLHDTICQFRVGPSMHFKNYSILMHILSFDGLKVCHEVLKARPMVEGEFLPIQEWTYLWDMY